MNHKLRDRVRKNHAPVDVSNQRSRVDAGADLRHPSQLRVFGTLRVACSRLLVSEKNAIANKQASCSTVAPPRLCRGRSNRSAAVSETLHTNLILNIYTSQFLMTRCLHYHHHAAKLQP
jgi:hypothetical protein